MRKMGEGKGGGMNGHEILLAVHGMRNSGGRSCVDQGEVAPLFSVWMRDKRNRGCFGQTLFGHGQSTYKRGYHPSPPPLPRFTLFLLSLSRARSPPLLSPLHHSQLSRALYAALYTYTSPPIAFSLALCLMNAHSNILLSPRARGKMLSLARTGANHAFPNYSRLPPSSRHPFLLIIILRSS